MKFNNKEEYLAWKKAQMENLKRKKEQSGNAAPPMEPTPETNAPSLQKAPAPLIFTDSPTLPVLEIPRFPEPDIQKPPPYAKPIVEKPKFVQTTYNPQPLVDNNTVNDIWKIIMKYKPRINDKHIFFAPNIPSAKLQNAIKAYALTADIEDQFVLIDNTAFGGAKDGCLLTSSRIYAHNISQSPTDFFLENIRYVHFIEELTSKLYINDVVFLDVNFPSKQAMRIFTDMLREIATYLNKPEKDSRVTERLSPAEELKKLKELFEQGLLTETEYEEKRQKYVKML